MATTYEKIAATTGTGATSVTLSSIPATYTDLILIMNGTASSATNVYVRFNGDTGSNYSSTRITGNGSSASSDRNSNYTSLQSFFGYYDTTVGTTLMQVMNYANTTTYKTALARYNYTTNEVSAAVGLWRSTSAINSITILTSNAATFPTSTTFTLYGIEAA
jgi:hypothetical protein